MKGSSRERGQAMTEYALIAFWFAWALFWPAWPNPAGGGQVSTFILFIQVFDIYINSFHSVISMPIP